ncbi:MAG: hypothetical protein ABJH68_18090, partial [Ilumatobacter sp.]|uniref:TetR/AcrR family transcriptional regulator n=1 Tax=Ilumatobacter sp. TaxID=1967498 RepID=UPI00329A3EA4
VAAGRRARRDRSRAAVIDAVFALIQHGKVPPSAEDVAECSGVSVSSIFRMFDGLDDMRQAAFERYEHDYAHLVATEFTDDPTRLDRIDRLVRARLELYEATASVLRFARQRALDHESNAARVGLQRTRLADQVQRCLSDETRQLTPVAAANLVAAVDALTAPEAFDVLSAAHGRTSRQIGAIWRRSLAALVADWCDGVPDEGVST